MSLMSTQRAAYNRNAILSATPAQLLIMLYDRLLLDLGRAQLAQTAGAWENASAQLLHAQDIIAELQSSLKIDEWDGADQLLALYTYVNTGLINANINRDTALTAECISLLEPLRQTWIDAAAAQTAATTSTPAGAWGVA